MKVSSVFWRKGAYYFHSNSETTDGVWIAVPPFLTLSEDESAISLGRAVIEVISASQVGIEHPKNWDLVQYPIPELAGVKSWNTFVKNARCVNVKVAGGKVLFTPSRNKGPKQYFEPIVDDAVELPVGSSEELIGDALREAFTQCK